jgi:hypothetical protein
MIDVSLTLKRSAVNFGIILVVAIIHIFRLGSYLSGEWYNFYYSYFSDFALTFAAYFLIANVEFQLPIRRRWGVKCALAFTLPAIAETCQFFGVPVLGVTFDPLDYLIYALGALAAVLVDTQVFSRVFVFWDGEQPE